jgi:hypothetical protein
VCGESSVCSEDDTYECFTRTNMDVLVLRNQLLRKEEKPEFHEDAARPLRARLTKEQDMGHAPRDDSGSSQSSGLS